jgi:hypothetical protein
MAIERSGFQIDMTADASGVVNGADWPFMEKTP